MSKYRVYVDQKPIKYVTTTVEVSRLKGLNSELLNNGNALMRRNNVRLFLVTCNLDTSITYEYAWKNIQTWRNMIVDEISKSEKDIEFLVSTIEHHHTIKKEIYKSNMYFPETIPKYNMAIANVDIDKREISYMSEFEKFIILYNYYHVIYYTLNVDSKNAINNIKMDAKNQMKWLNGIINNYDNVLNYAFSDNQLKMITKHMGNKTVLGYPHLHIVVGYKSLIKEDELRNDIYNKVIRLGMFKDVQVDKRRCEGGKNKRKDKISNNNTNICKGIAYVMKNHANAVVREALRRMGEDETIVKVRVMSGENKRIFVNWFKSLLRLSGANSTRYNRNVSFLLEVPKEVKQDIGEDVTLDVSDSEISDVTDECAQNNKNYIDPLDSKRNELYVRINDDMNVKNYVYCDGMIYKKVEGSKRTYKEQLGVEEYLNCFMEVNDVSNVARHSLDVICRIMHSSDRPDEEKTALEGDKIISFPRIVMDYRMIEYNDFYYNTVTHKIYVNQSKYYCYIYNPNIKLEGIIKTVEEYINNGIWPELIVKHGLNTVDDLLKLYELMSPHNVKSRVPTIIGSSNSGKSTLIRPFIEFYPDHKIGRIGKSISEYHMNYQVKGKYLIVMEEINDILNSDKDRGDVLKLLGGEEVVSNKKHGDIGSTRSMGSKVITLNLLKNDVIYLSDSAVTNRMHLMQTQKGELEEIDHTVYDVIYEELPYIILMLGLLYNVTYGKKGILISNDISESDMAYIENKNREFKCKVGCKTDKTGMITSTIEIFKQRKLKRIVKEQKRYIRQFMGMEMLCSTEQHNIRNELVNRIDIVKQQCIGVGGTSLPWVGNAGIIVKRTGRVL